MSSHVTIIRALQAAAAKLRQHGSQRLMMAAKYHGNSVVISARLESILLEELRIKAAIDALMCAEIQVPPKSLSGYVVSGIHIEVNSDQWFDFGVAPAKPPDPTPVEREQSFTGEFQ